MKLFSGFPSGKVEVTPLPNLFFSELCPAIDDFAELKVTLHIFWLIANRKGSAPRCVTASELRADRTLMQSLAASDAKPDDALPRALAAATERGTLLHREAQDGDGLYFLNTDAGRRAFGKSESVALPRSARQREPVTAGARLNIFKLYEDNIGLLTPMLSEELKEAEKEFPAEWIADAFKIAVKQNKRSWAYVHGILKRMKSEGRGSKKGKTWYGDQSKFIKR
ncbi:MAG: DnaD domain protein [Chloroflexota bacterium]|nr:DnaD domain protein [Chloroflexota bacterium]